MKHFQSLAATTATLLFAASCSIKEDRIQCHAPVTVCVNTFSVSQEDIPLTKAAQSVADYTAVKSITLAFFNSDGTEQYKSTQLRSSAASFGNFSLTLPYGSYKMIVIASLRMTIHHAQQSLRSKFRRREAQRHVPV